ncbi:MAG: TonB-dependent receptor, partial [Deltaproteobacteria bacterium]|nr:TonB-dependent receptor [Deltaproteobacteria bacterium]
MIKKGVIALMLIALLPLPALGEDKEKKNETQSSVTMKEVVVTATRYEEEVSTIPANVTVITRKDIENSTAMDIPSILRTQVGINVTDVAGNRRNYRVDLRGFGETAQSNTLVLVDGRRVNAPDLSGADWYLIPLDRVERIEIVRGGRGSVFYGDNASGGVINIITREGKGFEAGIKGVAGSWNTYGGDAYVSGSHKGFSYALNGNYFKSDGYRLNSETRAKDAGLNLGYLFGERGKLTVSGGYHTDDTGMPGALRLSQLIAGVPREGTVNPDDFSDVTDNYVQAKPEIYFMNDSLFQVDFSGRKRESRFFASFAGGTFTGETEIRTDIASPQFVVREPLFGRNNTLTLGYDYFKAKEDIENTTIFFGFPMKGVFFLEKENQGFYIHDEIEPVDNLFISGGYRYDEVDYSFAPSTPNETNFDLNLFNAGINYKFYKESYVYFSYADGFRYPVLDEMFNFFSNTIDTTLVPQTSDDYGLGVRHYFDQTFFAGVNLFRMDVSNEIFFNPTGGPFGWGANDNLVGKSRREGIEIAIGKTFKHFDLRGNYTYTNPKVESGPFAGNLVPSVP